MTDALRRTNGRKDLGFDAPAVLTASACGRNESGNVFGADNVRDAKIMLSEPRNSFFMTISFRHELPPLELV